MRTLLICFVLSTLVAPVIAQEDFVELTARGDFTVPDDQTPTFYEDRRADALAIDASKKAYREGFAAAQASWPYAGGRFDVTIVTLTEEDGECSYRLLVNGEQAAAYQNPHIGEGSEQDRQPHEHTWQNIAIPAGATLTVQANAHTNGEIPEGDGTAWARGRWRALRIAPAGR